MSEKYKMDDPEGIYFLTLTTVFWIDLFTRKELKQVIVESLKYCQKEKGLVLYAWCLMPSHLHLIMSTNGINSPGLIRDFKKHTSKTIIKSFNEYYESRKEWLLDLFERAGRDLRRIKKYKVWQDGNQPKQLLSNHFMEQKLNYIHYNLVEDGTVEVPEHYLYSSALNYAGENGILEVELI